MAGNGGKSKGGAGKAKPKPGKQDRSPEKQQRQEQGRSQEKATVKPGKAKGSTQSSLSPFPFSMSNTMLRRRQWIFVVLLWVDLCYWCVTSLAYYATSHSSYVGTITMCMWAGLGLATGVAPVLLWHGFLLAWCVRTRSRAGWILLVPFAPLTIGLTAGMAWNLAVVIQDGLREVPRAIVGVFLAGSALAVVWSLVQHVVHDAKVWHECVRRICYDAVVLALLFSLSVLLWKWRLMWNPYPGFADGGG